ncbi:acyltransferase [Deinococcus depolymerans]
MSDPATPVPPASPASPAGTGTTRAARTPLTMIDVFRGLTITEVVLHHTTGMTLRHLTPGSLSHEAVMILNRTLHFAVPAFVFLSAVVLTRSLLRHFEPRRYFWRRLTRGGWPYLLWSALYMLWYVWTGQRAPETLTDPARWWSYLAYGKASYHLYFLLVALEVYLILPLLLPLARRRPSITAALLVGLGIQLGLYLLNRELLRLPFPASTVLWYLLPVTLGAAVGARLDEFPAWWRRRRPVLLPLLGATYLLYLPAALAYVRGEPVTPLLYSGLSWVYTSLMALTLLGLAHRVQRTAPRAQQVLATLGSVSLQVYLLHPALLQALERWHPPGGTAAAVVLMSGGYALLALLLPALLGRALLNTRLSTLLFGR